ncbi:MAG: FkbM family methyltransferase [Chromatiaceae bacterium]|nr:FkbM family methyltransferase [Chromatiaceae bacterium]
MQKNIKIGDKSFEVISDDNYLEAMGSEFEPHMVDLFRALVSPNDVVADVGANIGLTALLFSGLAKKTYAFEPSPSTYKILSNNLKIAEILNVETVNLGFGAKPETLTITFASNNRSGGFISEKIRPENGHITEAIQIETLDGFFADRELKPNFLKIDVEGFEQKVIKGGGKLLAYTKPTVVMEMNHFCLDVLQRITIPDFLDFMRSAFPYLYAIDTDNASVVDLHIPDQAYFVMHEHVVKHRFPNLVGGFSPEIKLKLEAMALLYAAPSPLITHAQTAVRAMMGKLVEGQAFKTPAAEKIGGTLQADSLPVKMSPGSATEIPITLKNEGKNTWYGYGSHPVLLSYHWLKADGSTYQHDGLRSPLACETLEPGKATNELVIVIAPKTKGLYQLVLTLVQEGFCWFEEQGFQCVTAHVIVE